MALKSFSEIIDNKAYRIKSKDRDIFENGTLQSFFGLSDTDLIEFILYDVNDNQLPQGDTGDLVRYIPINTDTIRNYFFIPEGTLMEYLNFPKEYFIDARRLCLDAGYEAGIFKVQITLLSRRVGSYKKSDKLWISEISPSRTELRLLPLNTEEAKKTDVYNRYRVLLEGKDFREDITPQLPNLLDMVKVADVVDFIKSTYGEAWYSALLSEFNIIGISTFLEKVHSDFIKSCGYEFTNRVSHITSPDYGNPRIIPQPIDLSLNDLYRILQRILIECVDYSLPNQLASLQTEVSNVVTQPTVISNTRLKDVSTIPMGEPTQIRVVKQLDRETEFDDYTRKLMNEYSITNLKVAFPNFSKGTTLFNFDTN